MFDINNFGKKISKLRKEKDLTQSELADRLSLTRQAISRYENGESFPDIQILVLMAKEFNISLDEILDLQTDGEKRIINGILNKNEIDVLQQNDIDDLLNLAPIFKPSILDKAIKQFKLQGINLESIKNLLEYLNDENLYILLENADYDKPNKEILAKLLPYMDDESKWVIFSKILEGKIDYHFLEEFLPACTWIDLSLIEAAVVEGALEYDALKVMNRGAQKIMEKKNKAVYY